MCCMRSHVRLLCVCMRMFSGSMLYVWCSDCAVMLYRILSCIVVLFIQYSALFCMDCILSFCVFEIAISGMGVYSSIGLTVVL